MDVYLDEDFVSPFIHPLASRLVLATDLAGHEQLLPELSGVRHCAIRWEYGSILSWIFMPLRYSKPQRHIPLTTTAWPTCSLRLKFNCVWTRVVVSGS